MNPAKNFQFISRWTESTKSSAVGPNHRAVINTSNEVKSPLLWEFWIYNFSLRSLERVLGWKHCKYKEWVSFFLGSWGMNRSAEQTNRPRTASRFTRFVCPALRFIPHEPRKKDTHSLNILINSEPPWRRAFKIYTRKVWFLTVRPLKNRNRGPCFQEPDSFVYYWAFDVIEEFLSIDFYVNYFQYNKIEIRPPCNKSRKIAWPRGCFFTGLGLSITSRQGTKDKWSTTKYYFSVKTRSGVVESSQST